VTVIILIKFASAIGLSAVLTPLVRWVAIKKDWIAKPAGDRWHRKPTALMGGVAIFAAVVLPLISLADFGSIFTIGTFNGIDIEHIPSLSAVIIIGATFLFVLGLVDDRHNIKPQNKLIGQIAVAAWVVFFGFRLNWFASQTLDTMVTLFWIVGLTNAFNLIDNMDGLCAGISFIAATCLAILFYPLAKEPFLIALVLAGATGGFLIYNLHPAKIFMGDCGSLVIGFCIGVLGVYYSQLQSTQVLARFTVPALIMLVPLMDTTLVTMIRILSGRKATTGGRDHTSHRLVLMGFTEEKAVLMLWGAAGVAGFAAVFVDRTDTLTSPAVITPIMIAMVLVGVYLSQLKVYPENEFSKLRDRSFTPLLLELTHKRQILLVLLDCVLIAFSYYLSYRLRFGRESFPLYFHLFLKSLPAVLGCKMIVFLWMGVYRSFWGFISTNDVYVYARASIIGTLASVAAVTFVFRFRDFSKGIFIIDWLLTTGLILGARISFRLFIETQQRRTLSGENVVIYGAGRAGELLLRGIMSNKMLNVVPVGFIDDDALKKGMNIQGYPILGTFKEFANSDMPRKIKGVLVSFTHLENRGGPGLETVKSFCVQSGLFLKQFQVELKDIDLKTQKSRDGVNLLKVVI
jgi:UDP-GlcNAc:undecaprenyl-phosphate/decaprenyl-phosphate GlcNAc-1-phosphate transferase